MSDAGAKQRILILDDEEMVLTSLSSFLALETVYEVVTFTSANEALEYVKANEIDLVVSDYLMPEMDGISFLAKVRDLRPEVPRIILTGYADKENAIKAINEVGLFQYIQKPWDNEDLLIIPPQWPGEAATNEEAAPEDRRNQQSLRRLAGLASGDRQDLRVSQPGCRSRRESSIQKGALAGAFLHGVGNARTSRPGSVVR